MIYIYFAYPIWSAVPRARADARCRTLTSPQNPAVSSGPEAPVAIALPSAHISAFLCRRVEMAVCARSLPRHTGSPRTAAGPGWLGGKGCHGVPRSPEGFGLCPAGVKPQEHWCAGPRSSRPFSWTVPSLWSHACVCPIEEASNLLCGWPAIRVPRAPQQATALCLAGFAVLGAARPHGVGAQHAPACTLQSAPGASSLLRSSSFLGAGFSTQ